MRTVFVEIIAKKKGCMLCDPAIAVLEEIAPGFPAGGLRWEVVDVGTREGLARLDQLTRTAGVLIRAIKPVNGTAENPPTQ